MDLEKLDDTVHLEQMPVLHVRGTHAAVGFTIGRQFKWMIEDVLKKSEYFNTKFMPAYETAEGREVYESSLKVCNERYPQYVAELKGIAKGANVPFHKLFVLNLEYCLPQPNPEEKHEDSRCSDLLCNSTNLLMGHNEDTGPELMNNVFILVAEIVDEKGQKLEKFTTFTYAGCLPGYTMGFNEHGFIHTINTLNPTDTCHTKTPRNFVARAMLPAATLEEALTILKDKGAGTADGFSINMHFANQPGPPMMYNVEVSPNSSGNESKIGVVDIKPGDNYVHCNRYIHLGVPELAAATTRSGHRHDAIDRHPKPQTLDAFREVLSDRTDPELPVYRTGGLATDLGVTVATGIFDISNRKWNIFIGPPNKSVPVVTIHMEY